MPPTYLNVPAALYSENLPDRSRGTWFCFLGNPIGQLEPLDRFSEPERGWGTEDQSLVTKHWKNKFGGITLNLVGLDSPNMHQKRLKPKKYAYMIGQSDIEWTKKFYGEDSSHYWQLVVGMRKAGMMARRVVTRQLAETHQALEDVVWEGTATTRILGLDAAYGSVGGDRCVIVPVEFGSVLDTPQEKEIGVVLGQTTPDTRIVLKVFSPILVPVGVGRGSEPEDQIVLFTKQTAMNMGIGPENVFFDGRATLAMAFSRLWSNEVNAVDFGGMATKRPVSLDHWTFDVNTRERRLKRCDEEYSKFVTELWFSVRLAIESNQIRGLPNEILDEGCQREWKLVRGDRKEVETKADMKLRTNQSPDFFDALVTSVEGARRRGFQISKLSEGLVTGSHRWLRDAWREQRRFREERELSFTR